MAETFRAHCPRCDGERVCNVHGTHTSSWEHLDHQHHINGGADHQLLECRGCEGVFYYRSAWDSEDIDHWYDAFGKEQSAAARTIVTYPQPEPKNARPDWVWDVYKIDRQLDQILRETYSAFEAGHLTLASIGLRTAFDRATHCLKIDEGLSIEAKVSHLQERGFIGETEAAILGVVADAGNAAAHRAWSPDAGVFKNLLAALEGFIYRNLILGDSPLEAKVGIPPRPPRPKLTRPAKALPVA